MASVRSGNRAPLGTVGGGVGPNLPKTVPGRGSRDVDGPGAAPRRVGGFAGGLRSRARHDSRDLLNPRAPRRQSLGVAARRPPHTMTANPELLLHDAAWLRRLARSLVRPDDVADDLTQDVHLAALQANSARATGRPWLAAVAANLGRLLHRRERRERERLLRLASPAAAPSAAELVEQAELQQRAVAAVLALPEPYRDVVLMRFLQGMSLEDTARRLAMPLETVRTRQRRALALLRQRLASADARGFVIGTFFVGSLVNAKVVLVAAGLAAFLGIWWAMPESAPPLPEPHRATVAAGPAQRSARDLGETPAAPPSPAVAERQVAEPPPPAAAAPQPPDIATPSLAVTVRWDDDGAPAPGVAVMCHDSAAGGPVLVTDAHGKVTFGPLAPGRWSVCTVDRSPARVVLAAGAHATAELRVPRGFELRGRVVDPDDAPMPFAEILVRHASIEPPFVFVVAPADANGRFAVAGMAADRLVGARHARFGTTDFELLRPDSRDHELVLTMPRVGIAAVTGRVVDAKGAPVAGAVVELVQGGTLKILAGGRAVMPPPPALTSTDAEGRFTAGMLRAGRRQLLVTHRSLPPYRSTLELAPGEQRHVDVQLGGGASLLCSVRGPDGRPALGAQVLLGRDGGQRGGLGTVTGDAPVRLDGLVAGPGTLRVTHPECATLERAVEIPAGGELRVDLTLERGLVVRGRLVDERAEPLVDWSVDLGHGRRRASTGRDGRFVLLDAAATGNTVFARPSKGFVPIALRVPDVDAGEHERTFVVGADRAPSARLRGICLAADGTPLAGANVALSQERAPIEGRTVTAADGTFEIGPLPPGAYRVFASHRAAFFRALEIELQPNEVRELPPFAGSPRRPR